MDLILVCLTDKIKAEFLRFSFYQKGSIPMPLVTTTEMFKKAYDGGFTSVMIDCSSRPFDENVEETKKVVEYAHAHGVVVEAELGTLAGVEDDVKVSAEDSSYTHPEEVEEFVTRTGCDSLAIAIGTKYKVQPDS